jgi:hypothetical protein
MYGMLDNGQLQLIDSLGRVVQASTRTGTTSEVISRLLPAGTYYLRAYYNGTSSTPFSLRVSSPAAVVAGAPLSDTVGDSVTTATSAGVVSSGYARIYSETLGGRDTADVYRLRVRQSVDVETQLYGLTGNLRLDLLNSSGGVVVRSDRFGVRYESIARRLKVGTYYLRVFSDRPIGSAYTLSVTGRGVAQQTMLKSAAGTSPFLESLPGNGDEPWRRNAA